MIRKKIKVCLIAALFLISAAGLSIHIRVHDPEKHIFGYIPFIAGVVSTFVIPLLFCFRKTLHLANILNGFSSIIGMITMTHFAITVAPIYPDVALALVKFLMGISIFYISLHADLNSESRVKGWNLMRYPNMGFWYVHLVMLSAVYFLGHHARDKRAQPCRHSGRAYAGLGCHAVLLHVVDDRHSNRHARDSLRLGQRSKLSVGNQEPIRHALLHRPRSRRYQSRRRQAAELQALGAYTPGANAHLDHALAIGERLDAWSRQTPPYCLMLASV